MIEVTVKIQSLEDVKDGKGILEKKAVPIKVDHLTVGILEDGMESGRTSLMFLLENGDKVYMAEMSMDMFEGLCSAAHGARIRFGGK